MSLHSLPQPLSQNQVQGPRPRTPTWHFISRALLLRKHPLHLLCQFLHKPIYKMCLFVDCTNLLFSLRKCIYNRAFFVGPFLKRNCRHEIKPHCPLPLCRPSKTDPPWKERNGRCCPAWLNCSQYWVLTALSRGWIQPRGPPSGLLKGI